MKKIFLAIVLLALIGCDNDVGETPTTPVNIRITNKSEFDFSEVYVRTGWDEVRYGSIKANQNSEYRVFQFAYRYAYLEVTMGGEVFKLMPIDYVGESLLKTGSYSYVISVDPSRGDYRLDLTLAVE